jgi:hypothetical protein
LKNVLGAQELSLNFGDGRPVRRRRFWADGQPVWR